MGNSKEDLEIKPVEQEVKEEDLQEVNGGACHFNPVIKTN